MESNQLPHFRAVIILRHEWEWEWGVREGPGTALGLETNIHKGSQTWILDIIS